MDHYLRIKISSIGRLTRLRNKLTYALNVSRKNQLRDAKRNYFVARDVVMWWGVALLLAANFLSALGSICHELPLTSHGPPNNPSFQLSYEKRISGSL